MSLRLRPAAVSGRISAPGSKSHTHRAFILAALAGNGSIRNALDSKDTGATLDCLHQLGFLNTKLPHEVRVGGTFRAPRQALNAHESGTTLRLLTAIAAIPPHEAKLDAAPGLAKRPIRPLLDALRSLGATIPDVERTPFTVRGPLQGGDATIPGDVSSQFVSALLLAAPLAPKDTRIHVTGSLVSRPYIDLTLAQLHHHGVRVDEDRGTFTVPGAQKVRQKPYSVPGDYSSAAFLLAAAAITGTTLTVENLRPDDPQGDRAILEHLASFGADVRAHDEAVTIQGRPLKGCRIDVGRVPDLFPILCAVAAVAKGTTTLHGAPHLRDKESDRIRSMATNLQAAGIEVHERPDGLEINGGRARGCTIQSFGDHRIAMAMSVLALAARGESTLPDPDVVTKSYPGFIHDLRQIAPEVIPA